MTTKEHDAPPAKAGETGPPATHKAPAAAQPTTKPVEEPDPTQSYLLGEKVPKPEDQKAKAAKDGKDGKDAKDTKENPPPETIITGQEVSPTPWNSPGLVPPDQVGKPALKPEPTAVDPEAADTTKYHPDPHTEHKDDPAKGFTGTQPPEHSKAQATSKATSAKDATGGDHQKGGGSH